MEQEKPPELLPCLWLQCEGMALLRVEEITPCPGGIEHETVKRYFVECYLCDARGPVADTAMEAINAWNTRSVPAGAERVAGLEAAVAAALDCEGRMCNHCIDLLADALEPKGTKL